MKLGTKIIIVQALTIVVLTTGLYYSIPNTKTIDNINIKYKKLTKHSKPKIVKSNNKRGTFKSYTIKGKKYYPLDSVDSSFAQFGKASWYGEPFHGRKTSNGEVYNMNEVTAAHKTLPINTMVKVFNLDNGKSLTLRINDRGPFIDTRIIDLSKSAAKKLGVFGVGVANVKIQVIKKQQNLYSVQVGVFSSTDNANNLKTKLIKLLPNNQISVTYNKERTLYKVQVFSAGNKIKSKKLQNKLHKSGFKSTLLVALQNKRNN